MNYFVDVEKCVPTKQTLKVWADSFEDGMQMVRDELTAAENALGVVIDQVYSKGEALLSDQPAIDGQYLVRWVYLSVGDTAQESAQAARDWLTSGCTPRTLEIVDGAGRVTILELPVQTGPGATH